MTDVALRDYVDSRIIELDRRLSQMVEDRDARIALALAAADKAVSKQEDAVERRLELLNEFKALAAAKDATFATRELVDAQLADYDRQLGTVQRALSVLEGRALALAGSGAVFGGVIGAVALKVFGA